MTRRTQLLTTTAAAAILGLTAPAVAVTSAPQTSLGSAEGVRYITDAVRLEAGTPSDPVERNATAQCDKGWTAISGGQSVKPRSKQGISYGWMGQERYWLAGAWQREPAKSTLRSFAVCMKTASLSSTTTTASSVPADSPVSEATFCADGWAVGGGVMSAGDPSDFTLVAGYPVDDGDQDETPNDGWQSYVDYSGDGGDHVHFSVRCLDDTPLTYRNASVQLAPGSSTYAKARCPKGLPVLGGGVYVDGAAGLSHLIASRPWDSKDAKKVPEDGWRGGVLNTSDVELSMTVHAVCMGVTTI